MNETTHKLTAAMVAAYPNAQVMVVASGLIYSVENIDIRKNSIWIKGDNERIGMSYLPSLCQLVLTSPANVTDAQALEVAKEYYPETSVLQNANHGKDLIKDYTRDFDMPPSCAAEISDICRTLNIDMGYKGIPSLIAAGLAVEKEVGNE